MVIPKKDIAVLRDLAKQIMELASMEKQNERRLLWKDFNSLQTRRVPIFILDPYGIWREFCVRKDMLCENELLGDYEYWWRLNLYRHTFDDDYITEPWITVYPVMANKGKRWATWGIDMDHRNQNAETYANQMPLPAIKEPEDLVKLVAPYGRIDRQRTAQRVQVFHDAVGDIIPVVLNTYPGGRYNLSYILAVLLGQVQMMYMMVDRPEQVHEISRRISSETILIYEEAERQGWFTNCNNDIQAASYCHELPMPGPLQSVSMKEHWIYDCAQEFEGISPDMYYEFLLSYQVPLYEKFGFTAYGCCENLTEKIKYLKKISNLRRVAVTPWADVEKCAQQLEDKYIISWRPNPADMVTYGFDPERIRRIVKNAKAIFDRYNCHWEVNLKDFLTVEHDKQRLKNWVRVVREAIDE